MIQNNLKSAFQAYKAPACDLLDADPEENFCVSGTGGIDPATEEDWGNM